MHWGALKTDVYDLDTSKTIIANSIARHSVMIGSSHFSNRGDDWIPYLEKIDSILAWVKRNDIPIHTESEWATILFDEPQDQFVNIFPGLQVDMDENGHPDGYVDDQSFVGLYNCDDGVLINNGCSIKTDTIGTILRVENLMGIEKGRNDFSFWAKGGLGDSITVKFSFDNYDDEVYLFLIDSNQWSEYILEESKNGNTQLGIAEDISRITF